MGAIWWLLCLDLVSWLWYAIKIKERQHGQEQTAPFRESTCPFCFCFSRFGRKRGCERFSLDLWIYGIPSHHRFCFSSSPSPSPPPSILVFHQADGAGNPVMDLGHVITALNKLDAASDEKIVLSSRDGKSLMVVTYADVAQCLESAYHELVSGSVPPAALQYWN